MTVTDRVLPHNLEAEKVVLGCILVSTKALPIVQPLLHQDDFFRRAHRCIYTAMLALSDKGAEIDLITLHAELIRAGELDEVGGPAYVSALTDGIPRTANAAHYAAIVREHAMRRALIVAANETITEAYDAELPATEVVARTDKRTIELQRGSRGRMVDLRTQAGAIYEALEHRSQHRGTLTGVPTGFGSIDSMTNGWQPGELIVIGARPSIGKTAFVLNSAAAAAAVGKHVVIFSLEMRRRQLEYRLLSMLSGLPATRLQNGWMVDEDYEQLSPALTRLEQLPLFVDDRGGQSWRDVRSACRRLRAESQVDLVVVDYVQLMPGSLDGKANRTQQIDDIALRLKDLSDELSVPLILLSQLSRAGANANRAPILSDLRESGALEQHADSVAFLHRENHRESGNTEFIMEKQRNGPTGSCLLTLTRETQTFTDGGVEATPTQDALPEVPERVRAPRAPRGWRRRAGSY